MQSRQGRPIEGDAKPRIVGELEQPVSRRVGALLDDDVGSEAKERLVWPDHRRLAGREVQVGGGHHTGVAAVAPEVDAQRGAGAQEVLRAADAAKLGDIEAKAVGHAAARGACKVGLVCGERERRPVAA